MRTCVEEDQPTERGEKLKVLMGKIREGYSDGHLFAAMLNDIYGDPTLREMLLSGVNPMGYVEANYGELIDRYPKTYILGDIRHYLPPCSLLIEAAFLAQLHGYKTMDRDGNAYDSARGIIFQVPVLEYILVPEETDDLRESMLAAYRSAYNSMKTVDYGRIIPMVNLMFEDLHLRDLIVSRKREEAAKYVEKYEPLMRKYGGYGVMDWFFSEYMPTHALYPEVIYLVMLFDDFEGIDNELFEDLFDELFEENIKEHVINIDGPEHDTDGLKEHVINIDGPEHDTDGLKEYISLAREQPTVNNAQRLTAVANSLFEDEKLRKLLLCDDDVATIEYAVSKYGDMISEYRNYNLKDWLYYTEANAVLIECVFVAIALDGSPDSSPINAFKIALVRLYKDDIKASILLPPDIIDPITSEGIKSLNDLFCDETLRNAILHADLSTFADWKPFKEVYDRMLHRLVDSGRIDFSKWTYGANPVALPETVLFLSLMTYNRYLYSEIRSIVYDIRWLIEEGKLTLPEDVGQSSEPEKLPLEELIDHTLTFVELTKEEVDYFDEKLVDEDLEYLLKNNGSNDDVLKYTMDVYGESLAPLLSYNFEKPPPNVILPVKNKSSDYLIRLVGLVAWMPINSDNLEKFKLCCEMAKFNPMNQMANGQLPAYYVDTGEPLYIPMGELILE
jgi:hypothetical protein